MKLYSKAVKVLKELPQEKFDVNQLVATLKNKGVKPAEIENAKLPATGTYPKQALMDVFETFKPQIGVTKYGALDLNELSKSQADEYHRLLGMRTADMTYEDINRQEDLERKMRLTPTQYHGYKLPGGHDYQEHLIQLGGERQYTSSHWSPGNILAHVRLSNRIMPDGRKMLHVEEVQSDWGQQGREEGFNTGEAQKARNDYINDLRNRFRQKLSWMGDENAINNRMDGTTLTEMAHALGEIDKYREIGTAAVAEGRRPPASPYVTSTQGWTDLALKHILSHAAAGNYDGVIFTPGQAQADRYGLEKTVNEIYYHPETGQFEATQNGNLRHRGFYKPEELPGVIGKELSEKLLSTPRVPDGDHVITGEDIKVGGKGMKTYYDKMLPKSVTQLAQQHDPSVKGSYEPINDQYSGFSIPMTPKLKDSINQNGFPAFKRGGEVKYAQGGAADGQGDYATPAKAGEFQDAGRVRGGSGLLAAPLQGLPQRVSIPKTGSVINAEPDEKIRRVASDYMSKAGLSYNPPKIYAKVDPARARRIAEAFGKMKDDPTDPLTAASYAQVAKETKAQYEAMKRAGFKAEFWHPEKMRDPYEASPRLAVEDIRKNNHMWVFPTVAGYGGLAEKPTSEDIRRNPMLADSGERWNGEHVTMNDLFRAVHDYFGHAKEGVGFRHDGEENAWRSHAAMFSPLARLSMTTETRGQNSWLNFGPHGERNRNATAEETVFAPQKIGILPLWAHHEGAEDFMTPKDVSEMRKHFVVANAIRKMNDAR